MAWTIEAVCFYPAANAPPRILSVRLDSMGLKWGDTETKLAEEVGFELFSDYTDEQCFCDALKILLYDILYGRK